MVETTEVQRLINFVGKNNDFEKDKILKKYEDNIEYNELIDLLFLLMQGEKLTLQNIKEVLFVVLDDYNGFLFYLYTVRLRAKFLRFIENNWSYIDKYQYGIKHLHKKSGVYILTEEKKTIPECKDIVYVGSTMSISTRYHGHEKMRKIYDSNKQPLFYYIEMETGFFDYELKLIRKLKPKYNKMHKGD